MRLTNAKVSADNAGPLYKKPEPRVFIIKANDKLDSDCLQVLEEALAVHKGYGVPIFHVPVQIFYLWLRFLETVRYPK